MNILDYLGTEFASFEEKPFNPVDSAALSQFCMVRAEGIVPPLRERKAFGRLGTIVKNLLSLRDAPPTSSIHCVPNTMSICSRASSLAA